MIEKIGLGGGCHWCTEGVFQSIRGVIHVDQGWIASDDDNNNFSEGVIVTFNSDQISLAILIEIHLLTHASSSDHSMRKKYRSAIYTYTEKQATDAVFILNNKQAELGIQTITKVLPLISFRRNKETLLNYYQKNPNAPFCSRHIDPKIQKLRKSHSEFVS